MATISMGDLPRHFAETKPGDPLAVVYPDASLSWAELDARACRRARLLASLGVRAGDLVTLAMRNGALFHETAFAIWKCGATPNVVSPHLPRHEFQAIVELVKPRVVIADHAEAFAGTQVISGDADTSGFDDQPFEAPIAKYWKAMTSGGSTGRPKVIVDHGAGQVDLAQSLTQAAMLMQPDTVLLNPGPLYHNGPFISTHLALFIGCKVIGMERFDPEEALRLIEQHRVSWVNFVPTMMHRIWNLPKAVRERYDLSSLKVVWHMAAPCPAWLKQAWIDWLGGERIWELYGGTESVGGTVIQGTEWLRKRGSVGKMHEAYPLRVLREDGSECARGETGEIYFKLPPPEARPYHYIGAEPRRTDSEWESLGDLGHIDEDGYLFLADRRTDLILRGGANVYPAEVEAALEAHPDVGSAVVVGLPCEDMGQRVHAIVQHLPETAPDAESLHQFAAERLAKYKLPESYEFVEAVLRDDAGKVRRSALRDERVAWLQQGHDFQLKVSAKAGKNR